MLLALLVVAISVMIYKKYKTTTPEDELSTEQIDDMFNDTLQMVNGPLSAEDSMILDLTGEISPQVGMPIEHSTENSNGPNADIDYSQPVVPPVNSNPAKTIPTPKAKTISNPVNRDRDIVSLPKSEKNSTSESSTAKTSEVNNHAKKSTDVKSVGTKSETKTSTSTAVKSSTTGNFYVVAGTYKLQMGVDQQVAKLKKMGFNTANRKVFDSSPLYFSAIAGRYDDRNSASKVISQLKSKGIEAFIKLK